MLEDISKIEPIVSLILAVLGAIITAIGVYWRQHKKVVELEQTIKEMDDSEVARSGNLVFDAILPNVDAAKAKIMMLIEDSRNDHRTLRIDNFGLDLETIDSMFRYTFINKIANRDIVYRGLVVDPDSKDIGSICVGRSNICQTVAAKVIKRVKDMIDSGETTVSIEITSYDDPPVMHGFLIDDEHLLIGFTHYVGNGLVGGATPYIYIKRDTSNEFKESMFLTYKSWFERWWKKGKRKISSSEHSELIAS